MQCFSIACDISHNLRQVLLSAIERRDSDYHPLSFGETVQLVVSAGVPPRANRRNRRNRCTDGISVRDGAAPSNSIPYAWAIVTGALLMVFGLVAGIGYGVCKTACAPRTGLDVPETAASKDEKKSLSQPGDARESGGESGDETGYESGDEIGIRVGMRMSL